MRRWGARRAARELRAYLADPRGIHRGAANRYVLHGSDVLAMPDLPPLNRGAFVQYFLEDVEALNHGSETPLAYFPDAWEALRGCVGGREFVYVDPRSQFLACPFLSEAAGSVDDEPVADLLGRLRERRPPAGCSVARQLDFKTNA